MRLDFKVKVEGVDVITTADEVWFVQDERICWTTARELWSNSIGLSQNLRRMGYRINAQAFSKRLREIALTRSP